MAIEFKIIGCDESKGREVLTATFPERTGQVLTLAVTPDELSQFERGATYELTFRLVKAAPTPKTDTPAEKGRTADKDKGQT